MREGFVGEEEFEGGVGRVAVGEVEEEELFEGDFAVGGAVGGGGEPVGGGLETLVDAGDGEIGGEGEEEGVYICLGGEESEGVGDDVGVDVFAVALDEGVGELVDEAHGVEGAGVDGSVGGEGLEAGGEFAGGGEVGEDDVAGIGEEDF